MLLAASTHTHAFHIVGPLSRELQREGTPARVVYGGKRNPYWKPEGARHIASYARWGWSRASLLRNAVRRAIRGMEGVIICSARYHLEQALLRECKAARIPCIHFISTFVVEQRWNMPVGQRAPRIKEFYDVGDRLWVYGQNIKDQLVAHGIAPERLHIVGHPKLKEERRLWDERIVAAGTALALLDTVREIRNGRLAGEDALEGTERSDGAPAGPA